MRRLFSAIHSPPLTSCDLIYIYIYIYIWHSHMFYFLPHKCLVCMTAQRRIHGRQGVDFCVSAIRNAGYLLINFKISIPNWAGGRMWFYNMCCQLHSHDFVWLLRNPNSPGHYKIIPLHQSLPNILFGDYYLHQLIDACPCLQSRFTFKRSEP